MLRDGAERVCHPTGGIPRSGSRRVYGLADNVPFALLVHVDMTFPSPAMRGHLSWPSATASSASHGDVARARPLALRVAVTPNWRSTSRIRGHSGAGPIFEVALHAKVSHALDPLDGFVERTRSPRPRLRSKARRPPQR